MGRKFRKGELDAINFDKMPQRCKELFFEFCCTCALENQGASEIFVEVSGFYIPEECQSPIEQILYFAFQIVSFLRDKDNQPSFYLVPQVEIMANNHRYFADFMFEYEPKEMDLEPANEVQLIIECDGHEFHKATKEQIKHDNERDYDLKMAGYDVLHYSGSQIFNDPIKCANEIYDYITIKTGGWKETKGEG